MQDTPAAARWRKLAEEHARSGMTTRAFADSRGVNPRTFAWWRSRLRRLDAAKPQEPEFTELVVTSPEPTVVLVLDSFPAHVVVDEDTDLALLRRLLEACA